MMLHTRLTCAHHGSTLAALHCMAAALCYDVIRYVMLTGTLPFSSRSLTELHAMMLDGIYEVPEGSSETVCDLLRQLFQCKPRKRISIAGLWAHPWMIDTLDGDANAFVFARSSPGFGTSSSSGSNRGGRSARSNSTGGPRRSLAHDGDRGRGRSRSDNSNSGAASVPILRPRIRPSRLDHDPEESRHGSSPRSRDPPSGRHPPASSMSRRSVSSSGLRWVNMRNGPTTMHMLDGARGT